MAVEVKEIVIRAVLREGEKSETSSEAPVVEEREALVQECVDQVLKVLQRKNYR